MKFPVIDESEIKNMVDDSMFERNFMGIPMTPPAITVGDKVRICKERWNVEFGPFTAEKRFWEEGVVISIARPCYYNNANNLYTIQFESKYERDTITGHLKYVPSTTMRAYYSELITHKLKAIDFTYIINMKYIPKTTYQSAITSCEGKLLGFKKASEFVPKLKPNLSNFNDWVDTLCTYVDTDLEHVCTTMPIKSKYDELYGTSAYPNVLSSVDFDGDVIGTVKNKEETNDGIKIYISMPRKAGKQYALKIGESLHKALAKYFKSHDILEKHFGIPDEIKTIKNGDNTMKTVDFRVKKIIHNGLCTIVFWMDNTKTIVKLKDGDQYDPHAAFCIAVAKKAYGNNSKISKIVNYFSKDVKVPKAPPREMSVEELKVAADKLGYRVSRKPRKSK